MLRTLLCAFLLCSATARAASTPTTELRGLPAGLTVTVQPKETAYGLAKKYGLSLDNLLSLNGLSSSNLSVGQVLLVSAPTYTVVKGDTAFAIARRYNLSVENLLSLNRLGSSSLTVGQVLVLAGKADAAASTAGLSTDSSLTVTPIKEALADTTPSTVMAAMPSSTILPAAMPTVTVQTTTASIISLTPTPNTPMPSEVSGADWLSNAQSLLGVPYVYGGKSRSGTDCSGFVFQVFSPLGLSLPRTSADQAQVGVPVDRAALQSGDLVFFDTEGRGKVTHVGIVVEGSAFINANSFAGRVAIDDLSSRYWASRYLGARRVLGVMAASH